MRDRSGSSLAGRLAQSFVAALIGSVVVLLACQAIIFMRILDRGTNEEVAFFFLFTLWLYLAELGGSFGAPFVAALTAALGMTEEPLLRFFFFAVTTLMMLLLAEEAEFSDMLAPYFAVADLRWAGAASAGIAVLLALLFSRMRRRAEAGRKG